MPYPYRDFRQWVFVFAKFPYMGNSNNAGGCGGNSNYNGEECYVFFKPPRRDRLECGHSMPREGLEKDFVHLQHTKGIDEYKTSRLVQVARFVCMVLVGN